MCTNNRIFHLCRKKYRKEASQTKYIISNNQPIKLHKIPVDLFEGTAGRGQKPPKDQRMFTVNKVPGFAAQMRRESLQRTGSSFPGGIVKQRSEKSPSGRAQDPVNSVRTRENSPKMPRPRSEEIPLEDMRLRKTSLTSNSSSAGSEHKEGSASGSTASSSNGTEPTRKRSEETSFTERHESRPTRRKGQVETV